MNDLAQSGDLPNQGYASTEICGQFEKILARPKIFMKDGLWHCTDSYVTKYRRIEWNGPFERRMGAHIELVDRYASGGRGMCCICGYGSSVESAYDDWYAKYLPPAVRD